MYCGVFYFSQIIFLPKSPRILNLERNMHVKRTYEILPKYKVFIGVGKLRSSSFIPSSTTQICLSPTLYLSSPFFVTQAHIL